MLKLPFCSGKRQVGMLGANLANSCGMTGYIRRMNTVLNLLTSDVHTAFVSLWVLLRDDIPFFHEAQKATLDDDDRHRQAKENIISRLMENSPLKIRNILITLPLAILEALDEYLYIYNGAKSDTPPPLLKVKDKTYIIQRREKRGKKNIILAQQTGHILTYLHYHWITPQEIKGINLSVKKLPINGFDDSLFSGKDEIHIYIGGFSDGITPYWDEEHQPNFLAKGLTEGIEKYLNEASEAEADIVVFPELSICPKHFTKNLTENILTILNCSAPQASRFLPIAS
ncbi:MAG: hypothetical protein SWO11_04565 [Thermodesulfobacteriota bacterium]|nr:hypothetical protein [Thermodesulfobacteriota bacterium]